MSKVSDAKVREDDKAEDGSEKKLKPCCACPETKKARDEWWVTLVVDKRTKEVSIHRAGLALCTLRIEQHRAE